MREVKKNLLSLYVGSMAALSFGIGAASAERDYPIVLGNGSEAVTITVDDLAVNFTQYHRETRTYWTNDKMHSFKGPKLVEVLRHYGVITDENEDSAIIEVIARNDFIVELEAEKLTNDFDPILAIEMDGAPVSDAYAPAWIVLDRENNPVVSEAYNSYWAWAVAEIVLVE